MLESIATLRQLNLIFFYKLLNTLSGVITIFCILCMMWSSSKKKLYLLLFIFCFIFLIAYYYITQDCAQLKNMLKFIIVCKEKKLNKKKLLSKYGIYSRMYDISSSFHNELSKQQSKTCTKCAKMYHNLLHNNNIKIRDSF